VSQLPAWSTTKASSVRSRANPTTDSPASLRRINTVMTWPRRHAPSPCHGHGRSDVDRCRIGQPAGLAHQPRLTPCAAVRPCVLGPSESCVLVSADQCPRPAITELARRPPRRRRSTVRGSGSSRRRQTCYVRRPVEEQASLSQHRRGQLSAEGMGLPLPIADQSLLGQPFTYPGLGEWVGGTQRDL